MSKMTTGWHWLLGIAIAGAYTLSANCVQAQITPDVTLPNNSIVTPSGNTINITGGTQAGTNLFHSFQEFSVRTGSGAFFNNTVDIQNIVSRVTGGSISTIDGFIRANGTANLFLINPNGIVFGPNASLNVGGSFVASTANAVQFGNIGFFSATDKNIPSPLLTINPSALLFNQINQNAAIQNNSVAPAGTDPAGLDAFGLRVPDGKSLLLVGANTSMDGGRLNAYGGRVELGGLGEPGTVALGVDGSNLSLRFPENVARGSVSLTNQAGIYVPGTGGGNIAVNARNLEILGGSVLSAGIGLGLGTPETVAGDITLNATGEIKVAGGSSVRNLVRLGSQGNGGNITIDSGSFSLQDGAQLVASTLGEGNAGNVILRAKDAVDLASNAYIFSTVEAGAVGKGGNIDINAATLSLIDGAQVLTFTDEASDTQPAGRGDAGNVNVKVSGVVDIAGKKNRVSSGIRSYVKTGTVGNGGNITIDSGSFSLQDGAQLVASTYGQGNAGNVIVRAKDTVDLGNAAIFSSVQEGGVGKGGNIDINAATLSLIDGAQLVTLTSGASNTQPAGRGDAGNVNVKVSGAVDIAGEKNGVGSAILSSVRRGAVGNGGNITIDSGSFLLREGAILEASTLGQGYGGNITINSGSFSLRDRAVLEASTYGQGNAGNVTVRALDAVDLAGNAYIFSTVEAGGVGKGGNIDINAATLSLIDGAQLITSTREASNTQPAGRGDAGNVNVKVTGSVDIAGKTNGFSSGIFSRVDTGAVGNGGNITIDSGSLSLQDGAQLQTSTYGQGNAGNVIVRVKDAVDFAGNAGILSSVEAGGVGKGGNIDINAATLSLIDGAQLITSTREVSNTQPAGRGDAGNVNVKVTGAVEIAGEKNRFQSGIFSFVQTGTEGNGGNITIDSGSFSLRNGAQLSAETLGQGNAGTIKVNAADFVNISGKSANFTSGLFVNSQSPTGTAGDIIVTSPRVTLDNGGTLNAESASGNGGNINLGVGDLLLLRRGSLISATAGTAQQGGDGGNITINAPSGFIVSAPNENSDITANAFNGTGGKIDIKSLGIFNFTQRSREDLVRQFKTDNPNQLNPQQLPTNDITAISQTNPTLGGKVTINTPDADQSLGLVELPIVLTDTSKFIANTGCDAIASTDSDTDKSKFTSTGRGGLPPSPYEPLSTDVVWLDTRLSAITSQQQRSEGIAAKPPSKADAVKIVPATGWVFDGKGNVTLISHASKANGLGSTPAGCSNK